MANVMIRRDDSGGLIFYLAKKDLEEPIESLEFDEPAKWGGEMKLRDGSVYYIEPLDTPPKLPITIRAKRMGSED